MEKINWTPLKSDFDNIITFPFIRLLISLAIVYVVVFIVLIKIRLPKQLANYIATAALLAVLYYSFTHGYLPGT
ncbi:hypothetical protein ABE28_009180 [Peribacillus muralis]|uniref:Uncharacterized protein n=1 Tax=Peribacillus muralis TaxID=264697 RepID=A0A1B3XMU3_9BACI|nr:hypothetical protein [Peribacillus muralis]AOH54523.1 hypothetical protein ABE28_009180 [Peribacillus muralis]